MKIKKQQKQFASGTVIFAHAFALLLVMLSTARLHAATVTLYTNDFEAYSSVATNFNDAADADPVGAEWNIADDNALNPTTAGAGVQVIDWLARSGSKSLLLRSATEAQIYFTNAKSGTNYQLDFWLNVAKGTGDRNFMLILRAAGADSNGDDYIAYRSDRAATRKIFF